MSRALRRALLLAVPFALLLPHPAMAATSNVSIVSFAFNPSTVKVRVGDSVHWTNTATIPHTTTSDGFDPCCPNGPSLWKSGSLASSGQFTFVFHAAGTYPYHCSIHTTMKGKVGAGMRVTPATGGTGTTFKVAWADAVGVPPGFTEDVQIMRPGSTQFVSWRTGQPAGSARANFVPDAGAGTYKFRARLNNTSTGKSSAFSAASSIKVS